MNLNGYHIVNEVLSPKGAKFFASGWSKLLKKHRLLRNKVGEEDKHLKIFNRRNKALRQHLAPTLTKT